MANIVFLRKEIAPMKNAGGAWGDESTGVLGIALPGTVRHEIYAAVDNAAAVIGGTARTTFSIMDFIKENWKLLSVGAVALLVLLKD